MSEKTKASRSIPPIPMFCPYPMKGGCRVRVMVEGPTVPRIACVWHGEDLVVLEAKNDVK